MERPGYPGARQRPVVDMTPDQGAQARHLVLCETDLVAAERGQRKIGDLEIAGQLGAVGGVGDGHYGLLRRGCRPRAGVLSREYRPGAGVS